MIIEKYCEVSSKVCRMIHDEIYDEKHLFKGKNGYHRNLATMSGELFHKLMDYLNETF